MFVCPLCASLMQVASPCPRDGAVPLPQDGDVMLGATLGSYRIAAKLGSGGMGSVYRAVQPNIGSVVAIKVLSHESANDSDVVNRFFDEARSVNVIRHHNIVNILDLARLPDGRPYIVMEFLDGVSLKAVIARGPMPVAETCRIVNAVLDALAAAHERGVLHRDLKPDNIVLSPSGRVTLVDFGVAKIGVSLSSTPRTESGIILGTPQYMSPEQAQGRPVDATADIYAMGVLLFEMVTGQKPFDGDSLFEILRQQIQDQPRPPSQLVALPAGLENIILIALAKDARARFGSARAMQNALRQVATSDVATMIRPVSNDVTTNLRRNDSTRREHGAHASSHSMVASAQVGAPKRSRLPWMVAGVAILGSAVAMILVISQRSGSAGGGAAAGSGGAGSAAMVAAALQLAAQSGVIIDIEPNAAMLAALGPAPKMEPMGPPKPGEVRSVEEYVAAAQSGDTSRAFAAIRVISRQPDPTSPFVLGADGKMDVEGFADFAVQRAKRIAPDAQLLTLELDHVARTGRAMPVATYMSHISATFYSPALAARPADVLASEPWTPLSQILIALGREGIEVQRLPFAAQEVMPIPACKPSQIWQRALQRYEPIVIDDARIEYNRTNNGWYFRLNDPERRIYFRFDDICH